MPHTLSSTFSSPFETASQSELVLLSVFQFCCTCVTHVLFTCSQGKTVNTHEVLLQVSSKGLNGCIMFLNESQVCWARNWSVSGSVWLGKQVHTKKRKVTSMYDGRISRKTVTRTSVWRSDAGWSNTMLFLKKLWVNQNSDCERIYDRMLSQIYAAERRQAQSEEQEQVRNRELLFIVYNKQKME